ncbi:putative toxin-antitoxin system toxin component, PIN family [Geminocystis herdmanii]|uniref:putative toxin-antitoxin system toxin component, PIN family n=1 Tax=Geminocystis herdmanii TaxID=669359 RepID=UPI00034AFDBB|nr:putative toxin-antitoxin system toxin component, PIN family [Geminocystis herdmanii]
MYRIVLDTNILISALISKKAQPHILYQAWWQYKLYSLITSTYQIREFERVVQYPKLQRFLRKDEVQTMIRGLYDFAIVVEEIAHVNYSSDPDDNLILVIVRFDRTLPNRSNSPPSIEISNSPRPLGEGLGVRAIVTIS